MYCSNCGAKVPDDAKFCPKCGAPVGAPAPEKNTAPASGADGLIDRAADDIGGGIDEALDDLKSGFKRADQKIDSTPNVQNSEDPDAVKQNVRNWFTPENIEKFAAVSLMFPLFMFVASWLVGLVVGASFGASWLFLGEIIEFIVQAIRTIVRIVFIAGTALGAVAMVYTVLCWPQKQNTWGWIASGASCLGFITALGILLGWNHVLITILMIALAVYGVDMISRVLVQHEGVESVPNPGADLSAYQTAYSSYKNAHPSSAEAEAARIAADPNASYFDGRGSTLFVYRLLWWILAILTASIGDAWMQAKIFHWANSHTVIDGKRLKFNGSGGSLLGHWIIWNFLTTITFGIYGFFRHVAMLKWQMKHTYYDGERGAEDSFFDGNTFQYIGYQLIAILLLVVTLGLAYPWTETMITRWEMKHSVINGDRLRYDGDAIGLLVRYIIVYLLDIVTLGIYVPWGDVRLQKYITAHTHVAY